MTGRAAGYCTGSRTPGSGGRGGRGWRNMFRATGLPGWLRFGSGTGLGIATDANLEQQDLASRAAALESELAALRARLSELESRKGESRS